MGVVLLKLLPQALIDGDFIFAKILGSAVSQDGHTHGYSVPNPNAQAQAIDLAMRQANVLPRTISYVEAHGTTIP